MSDAWEWVLDSPVPDEIHTGRGSALLLHGWLFCRRAELESLTVRVGGVRRPVAAFGMPRLDVYVARGRPDDTPAHVGFRCAFWVAVPLPGVREPTSVEIAFEATAADASTYECVVAHTTLRPGRVTEPARLPAGRTPDVAIAMATHDPDPGQFARQVRSLQAQTLEDWVCVVSDDRSSPAAYEAMLGVLGDDDRFIVSRSPVRQGFYWNFGRAMGLVPEGVPYVALCDQDDEWRPEKLARLRARMGPGVTLAFCDQRIVTDDGRVIADSYWGTRRNNWRSLGALLSTNTVTGAATLFRRDLLEAILPMPPRVVQAYHDHWVALCALATGRIEFVDEALYDYVQHAGQVIGHTDRPAETRRASEPIEGLRPRLGEWRTRWERDYFEAALPRQFLATALRARCGDRLSGGAARAIGRAARGDVGAKGLALTAARAAIEVRRPEVTIGHDGAALRGAVWRRAARRWGRRRAPFDDPSGTVRRGSGLQELPPAIVDIATHPAPPAPRRLEVDPDAPRRVNVVVAADGTLGPALAAALERSGRPARVVRTDEDTHLDVSPDDDWVATDRDTARAASAAARRLGRRGFLYVIDGLTPPDRSTYTVLHAALFSTELLQAWFATQALGVFGPGRAGRDGAAVYRPAIAPTTPPSVHRLERRTERRLLLQTRPETKEAPTLPELARLVLRDLVADGTLDGWELYGVIANGGPGQVDLGAGRTLEVLAPATPAELAGLYASCDLALAPVDAAPPGRAPLELAAAGVVTVTTTFGTKDEAALLALCPNLRGAAPDREVLAAALRRAAKEDVPRAGERVRGAALEWPTRWEDVFDEALAQRIAGLVDSMS